jgi:hypothetical protein
MEALADLAVRSRVANLGVEAFPRERQTPEAREGGRRKMVASVEFDDAEQQPDDLQHLRSGRGSRRYVGLRRGVRGSDELQRPQIAHVLLTRNRHGRAFVSATRYTDLGRCDAQSVSAQGPGCVRTRALGAPVAGAATPARI